MREIPLTQGKVALVDEDDYPRLAILKWHASCRVGRDGHELWYARRCVSRGTPGSRLEYMHCAVLGKRGLDHINGDGLDNRRCNLRPASAGQNNAHRRKCGTRSSRFKGVSWDRGAWRAAIQPQGYIGRFTSEADAARAYNEAASAIYGPFAWLNVLEGGAE
jgi:hypothetical protein